MLVCTICGKVIKECCDIFDYYEDEEGREVAVCGECIAENGLETRSEGDTDDSGRD